MGSFLRFAGRRHKTEMNVSPSLSPQVTEFAEHDGTKTNPQPLAIDVDTDQQKPPRSLLRMFSQTKSSAKCYRPKFNDIRTYTIHEATEESDSQIVLRDLMEANLPKGPNGCSIGSNWAHLLFGPKFAQPQPNRRSHHMLRYIRTGCTCLVCLVRAHRLHSAPPPSSSSASARSPVERPHEAADVDLDLNAQQEIDKLSFSTPDTGGMSPMHSNMYYTPDTSALANFVRSYALPSLENLQDLGAQRSKGSLKIGSLVRLHSRAAAKLMFTDDMRDHFGHLSYTGPITHEAVYRAVTTIGVNYYQYNKGMRERDVFLKGEVLKLPVEMGVVKLGTRPLKLDEVGSRFVIYRRQVMVIYRGELVLQGNSPETFIPTQIYFYVGIGEDGGCAPVFPDGSLGVARPLGVNELLLHHHMVNSMELDMY